MMFLVIAFFLLTSPVLGTLDCSTVYNVCYNKQLYLNCTLSGSTIGWKIINTNGSFCYAVFSFHEQVGKEKTLQLGTTGVDCLMKAQLVARNGHNVTSQISFMTSNDFKSIICFKVGAISSNNITCQVFLASTPSAPYNVSVSSCMPFILSWVPQDNAVHYALQVTGMLTGSVQYYRTNMSHLVLSDLPLGEVYIASAKAVNHCNMASNASEKIAINATENLSHSPSNITVKFVDHKALISWNYYTHSECLCFSIALNNNITSCIQNNSLTTPPLEQGTHYFIQIAAHYINATNDNIAWSTPVHFICAPQFAPSINYTVDNDTFIVTVVENSGCENFVKGFICPPSTFIAIKMMDNEEMKFPSFNDVVYVPLSGSWKNETNIFGSVRVESECGQSPASYFTLTSHDQSSGYKVGASSVVIASTSVLLFLIINTM